jgi:hypothetical protein
MKVGDYVTLPAGHRVGMGRLRESMRARVDQVQTAADGSLFYGLEWTDPRTGKRRTTWWAPERRDPAHKRARHVLRFRRKRGGR